MHDHTGDIRAFTHTGASWYGPSSLRSDELDEIMVGFYASDGGTSGEFAIRWVKVGDKWSPRLEAFDDSWSALNHFTDLLALMAQHDSEDMTPETFCELLKECGIKDQTQRQRNGIPMRLLSDVLVACSTVAIGYPENETTDQPKG